MDHGERHEGGARPLVVARLTDLGVRFDHWCFACGQLNNAGLQLDVHVSRDRAEATYTVQRRHQGYEGVLHGGVVTALLDEVMGWAIFHQGIWAVTARIAVTFRKAISLDDEVRAVGEVTRDRGRLIEAHGWLRRGVDGELLAEAEATFRRMSDERRQRYEQLYAATDDAFARVRAAIDEEERVRERGRA